MIGILAVAFGGAVGSVGRYLLSGIVLSGRSCAGIPVGTLTVNIVGSFVIGALYSWWETKGAPHDSVRLLLAVGVLGGFTTFSAFSLETLVAFRNAGAAIALLNVSAHLLLGLSAVWLGFKIGGIQ